MPAMIPDNAHNVRQPGPLGKVLALLGGAALLVLGFMFSLLLVAFAIAAAAVVWGYLWWKTRELRRRLREQVPADAARPDTADGSVFDGEAVRIDDADAAGDGATPWQDGRRGPREEDRRDSGNRL